MSKKIVAILLAFTILVIPFGGVNVFAVDSAIMILYQK